MRGIEFTLSLDWSQLTTPLQVKRTGSRPGWVHLDPLPPATDRGQLELNTGHLRLAEWQRLIERDLFSLPDEHAGISGRNLVSFLIRRTNSNGYNTAVRSHGRRSDADATTNLAYLFGLDWHLADRYRLLKGGDTARTQMQKAAQDPLFGRIIGRVADLRSEIALAERRLRPAAAVAFCR
ncbi:hypothetical protein AB0J86_00680 [Micromonospora sp. NPDC049559]|uniref:hypothetical protein n=1 Tax=Micromonospora sp. NPDC049559 TaxID=3155923 RepID=UPI0034240B22